MHNVTLIPQIKMLNANLVHSKASIALKTVCEGFCVKLPLTVRATLLNSMEDVLHIERALNHWEINTFFQELHLTPSHAVESFTQNLFSFYVYRFHSVIRTEAKVTHWFPLLCLYSSQIKRHFQIYHNKWDGDVDSVKWFGVISGPPLS